VLLDLTHLGADVIAKKLPDIADFVRTYLGIDPVKAPIPIQPTAHYAMGGIPTDNDGRVLADERGGVVAGFYAAGECACVSVHGANRLGTNSLVDIVVFGRRAGRRMIEFLKEASLPPLGSEPEARIRERIEALRSRASGESVAALRQALQQVMMDDVSVFRTREGLERARDRVQALRGRYARAAIQDRGHRFNTDLLEALELGNLLDLALVTVEGALARAESRGAHYREDFPKRDDAGWLKHTFATLHGDEVQLAFKPVRITQFQPQERKY
jgi:succinate dehydrogenase / fumarate reductase flavoprotein subunit